MTERRRHLPRAIRGVMVSATLFALLLGYSCYRWRTTTTYPLQPITFSGDWIKPAGAAGYSGYFRKRVQVSSTVVNAWIMISACDGYEVIVNGDPVSRQHVWRPTRPFQNGSSEKGQRVTDRIPAIGLNFPREYQWTGHESFRVPVFVDIRPELERGENVICVQVESRTAPAKLILAGEIRLASGERIDLSTSQDWVAESIPVGRSNTHWTDVHYDDVAWRAAQVAGSPRGSFWRTFDAGLFATPFDSRWLKHSTASAEEAVVFQRDWQIDQTPQEAWIRLATNRYFSLFINDVRVAPQDGFAPDLDSGQWIMERQRGLDPQDRPAILAPEETDSPFVGNAFERPPTSDPTTHDFQWMKRSSADVRIRAQGDQARFARKAGSVHGSELDANNRQGPWNFPEDVRPQSHHTDRQLAGFVGYEVAQLLRRGANRIEVRLAEPDSPGSRQWVAQLAIDGMARSKQFVTRLASDDRWIARRGTKEDWEQVASVHSNAKSLRTLPRLQYRCAATSDRNILVRATRTQAQAVCVILVLTGAILFSCQTVTGKNRGAIVETARTLFCFYGSASSLLVAAILVKCSFAERYEALWFRQPGTWSMIVWTALAFGIFVGLTDALRRRASWVPSLPLVSIRKLPKSRLWPVLICLVLVIAAFVRGHRLDFQPLDDDEYASTQAILAIANTGIPEFGVEGIWYTRSPLFHYVIGACAFVGGENLWSMRLPCVLFGVATCWLTYLTGSRLLKSPWIGFGAMTIMAIHPFEVFTSHVIRFYQMQQFLALLTVYFFCKGFVREQLIRYRYLTILAFLGTVLCQEASCLIGFSLLLGYLAFAQEKSAAANVKLLIAATCALVVIALDYLVFQSRCMTRVAGVSPNLEATISPHLWHPYNFLSLFVCYSRLHVVASCFLICGFPLVCRERQRNTLALYLILFSGIIATNVLVTHISLRYQYWLIPIWVLLSLEGLRALSKRICAYGLDLRNEPHRHRRLATAISFVLFLACVCSMSPWRIAGSHHAKLLGDSTGALQFVSRHAQQGDQVMVTEPHTHAALIETGRVDFDLSVPLLYDFAVMKNGELIDRNGGAKVIGNLPKLTAALHQHDRVWIAVNREKLRNRGKNLRWEYPGARVDLFLRENCELVFKTYLWSVFLWDADSGRYSSFRQDQL